jgi:CubicO group peptidase (beta-lactamase class C family)
LQIIKSKNIQLTLGYFLLWAILIFNAFTGFSQNIDTVKIDNVVNENITATGSINFILSKNNSIVYNKSFSTASQKINATSRIKISTASIWLATAAVLTTIEKKSISLDTEIGKILPQFQGEKGKVTIRQLLSHTSGFPTNSIYIKDRNLTLAQSVDSIAKNVTLSKTPGKAFSYGGTSIQIAARIAEVIAEKSWEQLFFEEIASPCQMTVTDFGKAKSVMVGDGAYSSGKDYSNFLKMILNKGIYNNTRILSEKMITEMFTDHTSKLPLGYTPYKFRTSQNSRFYGLGVWIERIDPKTKIATEVNGQGARGFTPWLNTCDNTTAVVAVYGDLKSVQNTIDGLKSIIENRFSANCYDISTENSASISELVNEIDISAQQINIAFFLEKNSFVNLKFFDPLGNEIAELVNKQLLAGEHFIPFSTNNLPSGVYFYRLKINERLETKKVTVKK